MFDGLDKGGRKSPYTGGKATACHEGELRNMKNKDSEDFHYLLGQNGETPLLLTHVSNEVNFIFSCLLMF